MIFYLADDGFTLFVSLYIELEGINSILSFGYSHAVQHHGEFNRAITIITHYLYCI